MMKHAWVPIACTIVLGCVGDASPTGFPSPTPLQSFALTGTVRDFAGLPIPGALAEIVGGPFAGGGLTGDSGTFHLQAGRGQSQLRVWKDGYSTYTRFVTLFTNQSLAVQLMNLDVEFEIALGRTIRSYVPVGARPCDPVRWDARAPCRRFRVTAPASGELVISVSWDSGEPLDAVIISPMDTYLGVSQESGVNQVTVRSGIEVGVTYEVRVHSYSGEENVFNLRADVRN